MFWGLITIREFNYRFTNSVAYYEILTLDVPYTDYGSENEESNNGSASVDEESIRKNKEAQERAMERKK